MTDEEDRPSPLLAPIDPAVEAEAVEFLRAGGGFVALARLAPPAVGAGTEGDPAGKPQPDSAGFIA